MARAADSGQSVSDRLIWIVLGWALAQAWERHSWAVLKTNDKHVLKAWRERELAERDLRRAERERLR